MRYSARNFDLSHMRHNLITAHDSATKQERSAGLLWYKNAHSELDTIAARYDEQLHTVAGCFAALSVGTNYQQNMIDLIRLLEHEESATVTTYGRQKSKALMILWGENPLEVLGTKAFKTKAFYTNCLFPDLDLSAATVDRHCVRALIGHRQPDTITARYVDTPNKYNALQDIYLKTAADLQLLPQQLQAIVWLVVQRMRNSWLYRRNLTGELTI